MAQPVRPSGKDCLSVAFARCCEYLPIPIQEHLSTANGLDALPLVPARDTRIEIPAGLSSCGAVKRALGSNATNGIGSAIVARPSHSQMTHRGWRLG
jgi:hypothetical protein